MKAGERSPYDLNWREELRMSEPAPSKDWTCRQCGARYPSHPGDAGVTRCSNCVDIELLRNKVIELQDTIARFEEPLKDADDWDVGGTILAKLPNHVWRIKNRVGTIMRIQFLCADCGKKP